MSKWKKKYSKYKLRWFDTSSNLRGNSSFLGRTFKFSYKGILFGAGVLGLFVGFDFLFRLLIENLDKQAQGSPACTITNWYYVHEFIARPNLEYFADVISIGAGVLGVLLGLLYTAFITIVSTKYSNISSTISSHLMEQKTINRYFVFLSTLTALSVFFQLSLVFGYPPTIVSCFLFAILIIVALTSFVRYGKFLLIYFDISYLVEDVISKNNVTIAKIVKQKSHIERMNNGRYYLNRIYRNIRRIELVIGESKSNPQITNTSLDSISESLLDFSVYYTRIKHTIPSRKGWPLQERKFKDWENASETDFSLLQSTGVDMLPIEVDSYNLIEKAIIDAQFKLFYNYINSAEQVQPLLEQHKLVQTIAIQCDSETLKYFFDKLRTLVLDKIESGPNDMTFRLHLVSMFSGLLIFHMVGLNHNLSLFSPERLRQLAAAVHKRKNTDRIFEFPYYIRKWLDTYQEKLAMEIVLEGSLVTPLFYTEFELARTVQSELRNYWAALLKLCRSEIETISKELVKKKRPLEALMLNIQCVELSHKVSHFIETTDEKIATLNELNFQKNKVPFSFEQKDDLLKQNVNFKEYLMSNIWEHGFSSYKLANDKLPDIFGSYYHRILADIIDKLLTDEINAELVAVNLPKYLVSCFFYIDDLREKYQDIGDLHYRTSKLHPLIMDLYEVSAIVILVAKIKKQNSLLDSMFSFWEKLFKTKDEELKFWRWVNAVYTYFNQSMFGLSTSSYIREHGRKRRFLEYLTECKIVRTERMKGRMSFMEYYVTDVDDVYVAAIAKQMHIGSMHSFVKLDEVFVEYFLRTRIALSDLNISETDYGQQLERTLDRTKE